MTKEKKTRLSNRKNVICKAQVLVRQYVKNKSLVKILKAMRLIDAHHE